MFQALIVPVDLGRGEVFLCNTLRRRRVIMDVPSSDCSGGPSTGTLAMDPADVWLWWTLRRSQTSVAGCTAPQRAVKDNSGASCNAEMAQKPFPVNRRLAVNNSMWIILVGGEGGGGCADFFILFFGPGW